MEGNPGNLNQGVDRISNLPDDLLINILSQLPWGAAVRSSLLSRRWRYIWSYIPELVFDYRVVSSRFVLNYNRIINRLVLNRQAGITKFSLVVDPYMHYSFINHLIRHLTRHHVLDFTLLVHKDISYRMTSHFYAFRKIRHLHLLGCRLAPPPQIQGFRSLVTLVLKDVHLYRTVFDRLFSHCPLLENVQLMGCRNWGSIAVEGPRLRSFIFHGFIESIHFKRCPLLAQVYLCTPKVEVSTDPHRPCYCIDDMTFVPLLDNMHLYPRIFKFTDAEDAPNRFPGLRVLAPNRFPGLRVLVLSLSLARTEEVSDALSFIRHSPNLETFRVLICQSGWNGDVIKFMQEQEKPNPYMNRLRTIELRCYSGNVQQIEFVKYLLASAAGLQDMVIVTAFHHHMFMNLPIEMRNFPWASPTARLTVRWPDQN